MRFTVVTYGTEGDTRPLVALSRGLVEAGHEVSLLAEQSTLRFARRMGIRAAALAGDIRNMRSGAGIAELMRHGGGVRRMAEAVAEIADENTASWLEAVVEDAARSDAVLFASVASFVGLSAAEHLNIPAIGLGLFPISPTREFPSALVRPMRMPGALNLLSHRAVNSLLWRRFRAALNDARRRVCGQPPREEMWTGYPVLYGVSRHLVPQPKDWPSECRVCGAWYAAAADWSPPADLLAYLDEGPPPIYVGFGSIRGFDPRKLLEAVIGAVAGRRTLFFPGWSGIVAGDLPSNFLALDDTPHDWLFPRVAAVVHHGGAGTSHAAARAGVPSIVVPFGGDQFFWAERLRAAGVAPRYVPYTRITARTLGGMLEFAERREVRERARRLGEAVREERGVTEAAAGIERLVRERSRAPAALRTTS